MLLAHELGHNWGRFHAPCGTVGGVDPNYPYADAAVGTYGFDAPNSQITTSDRIDIMSFSYCGDRHWISDYTYEGVMAYRAAEAAAAASRTAEPRPSLIVWGRVDGDSLVLEPSFRALVRPSLPTAPGPLRLEGTDEDGASVFDLSFRATPVAHAGEGAAVFAFAIPVDGDRTIASIQLSDALRTTTVQAPEDVVPVDLAIERLDGDRVRLRWDAGDHPLVIVRNPDDGTIMAFARDGDAVVRLPEGRAAEVVASTGTDGRVVRTMR
jgi:hypothetical protein